MSIFHPTRFVHTVLLAVSAMAGLCAQDGGSAWLRAQLNASTSTGQSSSTSSTATSAGQSSTEQTKADAAQSKPTQTSAISLDRGSTSLVDKSSASDLINTALSLSPINSGSTTQPASGTVTASLYSLYTLANTKNALTPSVYNAHEKMRNLFFTVGHESQQNGSGATTTTTTTTSSPASNATASEIAKAAASSSTTTATTTTPATTPGVVYGVRWLLVNRRDATAIAHNMADMTKIGGLLAKEAIAYSGALIKLRALLGVDPLPGTSDAIDKLVQQKITTPEQTQQLNNIIQTLKSAVTANEAAIDQELKELQGRFQLALDFQTIQRTGTASDDYRAQIIYDQGIKHNQFHFTFNGSYDYSNSPMIGADVRSERGAFEIDYNMLQPKATSKSSPLQLSASGEGTHTDQTWGYRAQVQLSIPLTKGVTLPASFGYSNELTLLKQEEKGVYGKFGISVDFSKLASLLQASK
jgi:hypothetical protein